MPIQRVNLVLLCWSPIKGSGNAEIFWAQLRLLGSVIFCCLNLLMRPIVIKYPSRFFFFLGRLYGFFHTQKSRNGSQLEAAQPKRLSRSPRPSWGRWVKLCLSWIHPSVFAIRAPVSRLLLCRLYTDIPVVCHTYNATVIASFSFLRDVYSHFN